MMEEIGGGGGKQGGEVCVSRSVNEVWKGMMNGLGFVMKLFLQILRGTPSMAQFLLSYIGFTFPLLSSSPPSFKPLPVVEIPLQETTSNKITDKAHDSSCLPGYVCDFGASDDCLIEKLTVRALFYCFHYYYFCGFCLNFYFFNFFVGCF
jgi:RNA polymerase II subunit A small phosphatase-like protein